MTDELTNYIEAMKNVARSVKNKRATAVVIFVSPPCQIFLPRSLQQFLYLASDLCFHIVAPNLRISANSWRPRKASNPAFLAELSKALQAYTGNKGNSQMLGNEATAFDFRMQTAHGTLDENVVHQVSDPTAAEKENMLDNHWYEKETILRWTKKLTSLISTCHWKFSETII